ncbi:CHASE domain-containing sensor histidine kinase [Maritalea sp.]|uniref:CHASE domain-containing sensor histidine kinase n=1 Tax=Maritalea sp. TaxID=2003361 RepID=UPI003EF6B70C
MSNSFPGYLKALNKLRSSPSAWGILAFSVAITALASWVSNDRIVHTAEERFDFRAADVREVISSRMLAQESILLAGVGFMVSSAEVTRNEWDTFVRVLRQDKYAKGSQGYGYSIFVEPEEKDAIETKIREEGFPEFAIKPEGARDLYSAIVFLEPFDARNQRAFGYDMWSNPVRREAMAAARDGGEPALSGMVTLVQENGDDVQNGFLMYAPVYKNGMAVETEADRRAAILGYVYSAFRAEDLMEGILNSRNTDIDFRIYDAAMPSEENLLYSSDGIYKDIQNWRDRPQFSTVQLVTGARTWLLEFSSKSSLVSNTEQSQPYVIAIGGGIINILIFMAIWSLSRKGEEAQKLASKMTAELRLAKEVAEESRETEINLRREAQNTNKRLELANDDLTQFASIIAHDLRAPLKRIESFIHIIQDEYSENIDGEGTEILRRVRAGTIRMRDMLDALHRYTTSGGSSLQNEVTDIGALVTMAIDTLQPDIGGANVIVDLPDPLYARCDGLLLQHVLLNLIGNALKFSDKENKEVVVSCEILKDGVVQMSVADNGIGIDPEHAHKVFNMFARLHNEEEFAGTGVGLAVCKRIIGDLGTEIWINQDREIGTEILFTLPSAELDLEINDVAPLKASAV